MVKRNLRGSGQSTFIVCFFVLCFPSSRIVALRPPHSTLDSLTLLCGSLSQSVCPLEISAHSPDTITIIFCLPLLSTPFFFLYFIVLPHPILSFFLSIWSFIDISSQLECSFTFVGWTDQSQHEICNLCLKVLWAITVLVVHGPLLHCPKWWL